MRWAVVRYLPRQYNLAPDNRTTSTIAVFRTRPEADAYAESIADQEGERGNQIVVLFCRYGVLPKFYGVLRDDGYIYWQEWMPKEFRT